MFVTAAASNGDRMPADAGRVGERVASARSNRAQYPYLAPLILALVTLNEIEFKSFESPVAPTFDWMAVHHLQDAIFAVLGGAAALYLWLQRRYFWALVLLGLRWQARPWRRFSC
jgi:hypothetical protein